MTRTRYRKSEREAIVAVRLDLETEGFAYTKWGGEQYCKAGDWLVSNGGDVYTIDADSFATTYEETSPGRYVKTAPVWAEQARAAGEITTKEGSTRYEKGDYLVSNEPDGHDAYAVSREKFESMYTPLDQ